MTPEKNGILHWSVFILSVGASVFMVLAGLSITWG